MDALKKKVITDFGLAIVPSIAAIHDIGQQLRDLKAKRGTPEGEVYHSTGNALITVPLYEYGDFADVKTSLEIYIARLEPWEQKIAPELRSSFHFTKILSEIDKVFQEHPEFNV